MSWITLADWSSLGATEDDSTSTLTVPLPPAQKSPLEAMLSARRRASEMRARLDALSPSTRSRTSTSTLIVRDEEPAPLPPPPAPAPVPVYVPAPPSGITNADLWKLVAVGTISGLIVSMMKGGRR